MLAEIERPFEDEMTDRGLAAARAGLERYCLATREVRPVSEMIRYVIAPDGTVVPDLARKLPGRGAWVTANRAALEQAIRMKAFGRAFRDRGRATPELPDLVERRMEQSALSALSMANKAGQVVTGFGRVEQALREKRVAALVHAREAAADGVRKLQGAAAEAAQARKIAPVTVGLFSGEQLDLALGRSNVVHAALLAHPASQAFLARSFELNRWRSGHAGEAAARGAAE